jgi:hypothetical protein
MTPKAQKNAIPLNQILNLTIFSWSKNEQTQPFSGRNSSSNLVEIFLEIIVPYDEWKRKTKKQIKLTRKIKFIHFLTHSYFITYLHFI